MPVDVEGEGEGCREWEWEWEWVERWLLACVGRGTVPYCR